MDEVIRELMQFTEVEPFEALTTTPLGGTALWNYEQCCETVRRGEKSRRVVRYLSKPVGSYIARNSQPPVSGDAQPDS